MTFTYIKSGMYELAAVDVVQETGGFIFRKAER